MLLRQIKWPHKGGERVISLFRADLDVPDDSPCCLIHVCDIDALGKDMEKFVTQTSTLVCATRAFTLRMQRLVCGVHARAIRVHEFVTEQEKRIMVRLVESKQGAYTLLHMIEDDVKVYILQLPHIMKKKAAEEVFKDRVKELGGSIADAKRMIRNRV